MNLPEHARRLHARLAAHTDTLTTLERRAWVLGLILYVGGDVATTVLGLQLGAVEASATGAALMQAVGLWPAMLIAKVASVALFAVAWAIWSRYPGPFLGTEGRVSIPVAMVWLGGAVTLWNAYVVAVHAGLL